LKKLNSLLIEKNPQLLASIFLRCGVIFVIAVSWGVFFKTRMARIFLNHDKPGLSFRLSTEDMKFMKRRIVNGWAGMVGLAEGLSPTMTMAGWCGVTHPSWLVCRLVGKEQPFGRGS